MFTFHSKRIARLAQGSFVPGADFILMKYVRIFAGYPILINRPIVVTPLGTKLCRPSDVVLDILPDVQKGAFTKEDGEKVVDDAGKRVK